MANSQEELLHRPEHVTFIVAKLDFVKLEELILQQRSDFEEFIKESYLEE